MLSCAERLTDPTKVDPAGRDAVPAERIRTLSAADLGPGPWGQDGSPTYVGPVKVMAIERARLRWPELPLAEQVAAAVRYLGERGALIDSESGPNARVRGRDAACRRCRWSGSSSSPTAPTRLANCSALRPASEATSSR